MTASLDAFSHAFHAHFTRDPNACVSLGVDQQLDQLPDPSVTAARRELAEARQLLDQLARIDTSALSFDDALDADLARLALEAQVVALDHAFNGRAALHQTPRAGDEVGDGIFLMLANDPRPAHDRLADMTARVEKVPEYVDAALARLEVPVARWVDIDVEKVEALPSLFDTVQGLAETSQWADAPRLADARRHAEAALATYVQRLRELPTTDQLHVGPDIAAEFVRTRGIELSLDQLHGLARDFLARTGEEIEDLRERLVARYDLDADLPTADLQAWLKRQHAVQVESLEGVIDVYEHERRRILAYLSERDLFPIPADQDMKLLRTPTFMEPSIPAGAMMSPPPFRSGVRTSLVYLTLSEELMDEHSTLDIPLMMVHEGIPGHHLQLAAAAAHPSIVRRHFDAMDQAEGWTTMLEDYVLDIGLMGSLTDESRFCTKRDLSRIGARVAIDLFFMTGDRGYLDVGVDANIDDPDPFVAAGRLLKAVTGFTDGRVQAELNWYSQERGYPLSYLTGNHLVWELKRDVEAGPSGLSGFDLDRRFHDTFLRAGNMPVSFLRRVFRHEGLLA